MYGKVCPECGARLDPGERCDCKEKAACEGANFTSGNANYDTAIVAEKEENVNGTN